MLSIFAAALGALGLFTALQPAGPALFGWFAGLFVILWLHDLVAEGTAAGRLLFAPMIAATVWLSLALTGAPPGARDLLLATLVTLWALKNTVVRHRLGAEAHRLEELRRGAGENWPWLSMVTIYFPGLLLAWGLATPLLASLGQPITRPPPADPKCWPFPR